MTHKYDAFYKLLAAQRDAELAAYEHSRTLGLTSTRDKLLRNVQATGLIINDVLTKLEAAAVGESPFGADHILTIGNKPVRNIDGGMPMISVPTSNPEVQRVLAESKHKSSYDNSASAQINRDQDCNTDTTSQPDQGACNE